MKDEQDFRAAYERLSKDGKCDTPDTREYERVLKEWHSLACFSDLDRFIVARANTNSKGVGREIWN